MTRARADLRARRHGFTLLEVLVATLIMGIAISGVLSGLAAASRNAARLTDYDRATLLAREKMDELLVGLAMIILKINIGTTNNIVTGICAC